MCLETLRLLQFTDMKQPANDEHKQSTNRQGIMGEREEPKANMWRLIQRSSLRAFVFLTLILEMFVFMVQEVMNINKWQLVISFHSDEL